MHTPIFSAVQILTMTCPHRQGGAPSAEIRSAIKNELVKIDVLVGSYALSQTPQSTHLEFHKAAAGNDAFREPELAFNTAMLCLHRSGQFIEAAAQLRYTYPSWTEHDSIMCKRQSDAAAQCRSALDDLAAPATRLRAQYSSATPPLRCSEILAEIHAIRTQLTATLIYILCIHNPFQTAYDEHEDHFRSIVSDAAALSRLRRRTTASAFKRFTTRPGIISPLFVVSMKCRNQLLRALATTMLNQQGREGPADGHIMAAIGTRLAALEAPVSVPCSPSAPLAACDVLEVQRVHGYGVSPPRVTGEGRRVVDVTFSRPNPPLVQGWGHVDYSGLDNWIMWAEPVDI